LRNKAVLLTGPLQDLVTWYGIKYAGAQVTQWDFQNKATRNTIPTPPSFVLRVPLRNLHPTVINFAPCDWILQRAYSCTPEYEAIVQELKQKLYVENMNFQVDKEYESSL